MINTALVGFGYAATTFHLPFLMSHPDFAITDVVTSNPHKVASYLPNARCVTSLVELFNTDSNIDLVVITTPNHLHFEQVALCIEKGIHVLVEKPAVTSVNEALTLMELAAQRGIKVTTYQNRRYDGDFLTVKQLIDEGTLKDIKVFESRFDRFRPNVRQRWREQAGTGTGIVYDLAPHLIDQVLCLFGKPISVTAQCLPLRKDAESVDYFDATLMYADKVVKISSSPYCASEVARFRIQTPFGTYQKDGLDRQEEALKQGHGPTDPKWETQTTEVKGYFHTDNTVSEINTHRGNYMAFYDHMRDGLTGMSDMPVSMADIVTQMHIIEAMLKSSESQTTVAL